MTVQKLKQLVQRLFKADINAQELDSGVMQLYYISQEVQFLVHVLHNKISFSLQLHVFPYARLCFKKHVYMLQMPDQEIPLENDMKEIGFYSIEHGDTLVVKWADSAEPSEHQ